jgi:tetratricopeptide (TPR) repeat protein
VNRAVPADLETIVLKAMAKNPAERYATAQELADDLRRFLDDRPIRARRPGLRQRLVKWSRRHRTVVVATTVSTFVVLLVTVVLLLVSNVRIQGEQKKAETALDAEADQRRRAEENLKLALQALDEVFIRPAEDEVLTRQRESQLPLAPALLERVDRDLLQKGLAFYEKFAQANSANTLLQGESGKAYQRAGYLHLILGQQDKAEAAYRKAMAILERLTEEFPADAEHRRLLLNAYHWLGQILKRTGRAQEAASLLQKNVTVSEQLVIDFPTVADYRNHLCQARCALGDVLEEAGQHAEAEQSYRRALDLARQLLADFPTVAEYRQTLTQSQASLSRWLIQAGRLPEAEQACRETMLLHEKLAAAFPNEPAFRDGPALCHVGLGDVLWVADRFAEAETEYQRALQVRPDCGDANWKLAWFLVNCAETPRRNPARAIELTRKALARKANSGHYWKTLGLAYYRTGQWDAAIAALKMANPLGAGGGSYEWFPLAMCYWQRGDHEQARQWYRRACQWMEDHKQMVEQEPGFYWKEELARFRAEAAGLLGVEEPPSNDTAPPKN